MKSVRLVSMIACALLLSTVAFAKSKDKHQGKMDLMEAAKIGSTQLQPGHYKLEWRPEQGNSVKLEVLQNGKTVVTTTAKLKDLARPAPYNAVAIEPTSQNRNQQKIEEIDFVTEKRRSSSEADLFRTMRVGALHLSQPAHLHLADNKID